jgi:ribosomal protein S13
MGKYRQPPLIFVMPQPPTANTPLPSATPTLAQTPTITPSGSIDYGDPDTIPQAMQNVKGLEKGQEVSVTKPTGINTNQRIQDLTEQQNNITKEQYDTYNKQYAEMQAYMDARNKQIKGYNDLIQGNSIQSNPLAAATRDANNMSGQGYSQTTFGPNERAGFPLQPPPAYKPKEAVEGFKAYPNSQYLTTSENIKWGYEPKSGGGPPKVKTGGLSVSAWDDASQKWIPEKDYYGSFRNAFNKSKIAKLGSLSDSSVAFLGWAANGRTEGFRNKTGFTLPQDSKIPEFKEKTGLTFDEMFEGYLRREAYKNSIGLASDIGTVDPVNNPNGSKNLIQWDQTTNRIINRQPIGQKILIDKDGNEVTINGNPAVKFYHNDYDEAYWKLYTELVNKALSLSPQNVSTLNSMLRMKDSHDPDLLIAESDRPQVYATFLEGLANYYLNLHSTLDDKAANEVIPQVRNYGNEGASALNSGRNSNYKTK